jgi:small subunit ribosomal protein S9
MAETTKTEKIEPKEKTVKKPAVKKPVAPKKAVVHKAVAAATADEVPTGENAAVAAVEGAPGRYTFATGRRKTAVANIRLFHGAGKSTVNHKTLPDYFGGYELYINAAVKPMQVTGTEKVYFAFINVKGGGKHSQAEAIAHGIAIAISVHDPEYRKVLKKNGLLTRDSRMKERKKPGLKRARRGPQWAKR